MATMVVELVKASDSTTVADYHYSGRPSWGEDKELFLFCLRVCMRHANKVKLSRFRIFDTLSLKRSPLLA